MKIMYLYFCMYRILVCLAGDNRKKCPIKSVPMFFLFLAALCALFDIILFEILSCTGRALTIWSQHVASFCSCSASALAGWSQYVACPFGIHDRPNTGIVVPPLFLWIISYAVPCYVMLFGVFVINLLVVSSGWSQFDMGLLASPCFDCHASPVV